jgi:hypothetical protein
MFDDLFDVLVFDDWFDGGKILMEKFHPWANFLCFFPKKYLPIAIF